MLILAGATLLTHPLWTGVEEGAAQQRLATRFVPPPASAAPPAATPAPPPLALRPLGSWRPPGPTPPVFGRLDIPAIGLRAYVVRGATLTDYYDLLAWGPAHLKGTAEPGGVGNSVIFGHVDEFGSPFRELDRLKPGDAIDLTAGNGRFVYRVQRIWSVAPTDVSVVAPTPGVRDLTLFTCTGTANTLRLIVRAGLATA